MFVVLLWMIHQLHNIAKKTISFNHSFTQKYIALGTPIWVSNVVDFNFIIEWFFWPVLWLSSFCIRYSSEKVMWTEVNIMKWRILLNRMSWDVICLMFGRWPDYMNGVNLLCCCIKCRESIFPRLLAHALMYRRTFISQELNQWDELNELDLIFNKT